MIEVTHEAIDIVSQIDLQMLDEQACWLESLLQNRREHNLLDEQVDAIEGVSNFIARLLDSLEYGYNDEADGEMPGNEGAIS